MTYKDILCIILTDATGHGLADIKRLLDHYDDTYQGTNRLLETLTEEKSQAILFRWRLQKHRIYKQWTRCGRGEPGSPSMS